MNRKKLLISLAMTMLSMAGLAADNLPALRVQGKNLVDANGKTVVLHGVMDTPNRYFNGWRWQQWKADYSESDIKPCLEYFSKQFSAITDKKQGAYCTVFQLHMDPCWTNDPKKKAENEADISAFDMKRYRLYLHCKNLEKENIKNLHSSVSTEIRRQQKCLKKAAQQLIY